MINKTFIEETDKLIELFKTQKIEVANGNLIVAKVKADEISAGGIFIPKEANRVKDYNNGLARIIAVADNADEKYKPGQYIIHSHEARYKPHVDALREFLNNLVNDDFLFAVQDNNVIMYKEGAI